MFLRAQLSSQLASLADFLLTVLLTAFCNFYYVLATFTGSVFGGIINGIVNYHWTFKASGINKKRVAIRYAMIWIGSIILNTGGVFLIMEMLKKTSWLTGYLFDDIFFIVKIVVAIVVGFTWNYHMQRVFVYKGKNI